MLCAALAAGLMASTPASAAPGRHGVTDPKALAHVEAATSAWQIGDYETAATHLKSAYAIEQRPELLYAWATVERHAGHHKVAAGLYEAYVEQEPNSPSAGEARAHIVELRALAGEPIPPPEIVKPSEDDGTTDESTPPPPPDTDDDAAPSPLKGEKLAPALIGAGAAVAIAGGVLMGVAQARVTDSANAPTEDAYFSELDAGRSLYYGGAATLGVGGLIVLGGVIRYAVVARRAKSSRTEPSTDASAMVMPRGFGLTLSGRF